MPPFHSDNKIFLHPSPTQPPLDGTPSSFTQTSNAIFPHLDTCIFEALHIYENPIEKGILSSEVDLIDFATLCYCLRF